HIEHVVHAVHLLLQRRGDGLLNGDSICACIRRRDDDLRRHNLRKLRQGQAAQRDETAQDAEDRDHHGHNGWVDEAVGHQLAPVFLGSATNGVGCTAMPGRTFCSPSTTTRSPGCNPSLMTHIVPTRSPTLTVRILILFSLSTTAI